MNDYFMLDEYEICRLNEHDAPAFQQFFEQCGDYFELVEGRQAAPTSAVAELADVPPGCKIEDLFCFGIYTRSGEIVGVLIAVRDYRTEQQWYLTLLLIHPDLRRHNLGKAVYARFEEWVRSFGAQTVLLAVVEANQDGARFWQSLGFVQRTSFPGVTIGLREHVLLEFEKPLG